MEGSLVFKRVCGLLVCVCAVGFVSSASAAVCNNTNTCSFVFTTANGGSGLIGSNFGTVNLSLQADKTIKFAIDLSSSGLKIWDSQGAFPGAFGFNDNNADTLTIGSYSPSTYSGSKTNASYPSFGTFDDIAAVSGPGQQQNGANLSSTLSFVVSSNQAGGFTDVNQLVKLTGSAYFVAHVQCPIASCGGAGTTGEIIATKVIPNPEPSSYLVVLGAGLGAIFLVKQRRKNRSSAI
jgi:hypothetical protein